jgi:hypothetical protein
MFLSRTRHVTAARSLSEKLELYSLLSTVLLGFIAAYYVFNQYSECGKDILCYDIMEISGCVTCLIGVILSYGMRKRFRALINRLIASGAILPKHSTEEFEDAVTASVGYLCIIIMGVLTASVFIGYILAAFTQSAAEWHEALFSCWAASVVGERFGRLIRYARVASLVTHSGADFRINFWHPDNAGGLLPFSNFYLYTALLASIPTLWLSFWWVAIPYFDNLGLGYGEWRRTYEFLWIVAIVLLFFSFFSPVFGIHKEMEKSKSKLLSSLGWIRPALTDLHQKMAAATNLESALPQYNRIDDLKKLYSSVMDVNTWPLNRAVVTKFSGLSLGQLLIPLFANRLMGEPFSLDKILDWFFGNN